MRRVLFLVALLMMAACSGGFTEAEKALINAEGEWMRVLTLDSKEDLAERRDTVAGFTAVIFQHELDHLDGVIYTDKASSVVAE